MLSLPLADAASATTNVVGPVVGVLLGGLLTALIHRWRKRRKGDEDVRVTVRRQSDTLYGRRPSIFEKNPPPGLDTRVDVLEKRSTEFATVQSEHTEMLTTLIAKVTPNGGNTRESGDLLLLIARKLGIDVPEGEQ